jgi:hypothetical protein
MIGNSLGPARAAEAGLGYLDPLVDMMAMFICHCQPTMSGPNNAPPRINPVWVEAGLACHLIPQIRTHSYVDDRMGKTT